MSARVNLRPKRQTNFKHFFQPYKHPQQQQPQQQQPQQQQNTVGSRRATTINSSGTNRPVQRRRVTTANVDQVNTTTNTVPRFIHITKNVYSDKAKSKFKQSSHTKPNLNVCAVTVKPVGERGDGLFTINDISRRTFIGELVGNVYTRQEQQELARNGKISERYSVALRGGLILDCEHQGNNFRMANHSCDPNAYFSDVLSDGLPIIRFYALKRILKDQEITVNYGSSYAKFGIPCGCGNINCTGVVGLKR